MEIVFLGTACAVPHVQSGFTSVLFKNSDISVLVDAVDNPVRELLAIGQDPRLIQVLVLTHAHVDHLGGLPSLIATLSNMERTRPLNVLASPDVYDQALRILDAYSIDLKSLSYPLVYVHQMFQQTGTEVMLIPGHHSVPTHMVRIVAHNSNILYTSDIEYEASFYTDVQECSVLIHEATYFHEDLVPGGGHSSALQAGEAARALNAKKLFLCHLCSRAMEQSDLLAGEAQLAYTGEIIIPKPHVWYQGAAV